MESTVDRKGAANAQSEMARLAQAQCQNEDHEGQDPDDSYGDDYDLELDQDPQFQHAY